MTGTSNGGRSMIESLAVKAAEALSLELVKSGARRLGYEILGTPAQQGMEAVYTRAINCMLLEIALSPREHVDPEIINVAATVFQNLLKDEEIAGRLLGVALRAEPVPAEDLYASATSLGYDPKTLTFDFDDAIEVLCERIWNELLAESRKEGTRIQSVINEELMISIRGLHHGTSYRSANQDHSGTASASAAPDEIEAAMAKLDTLPLQQLPERSAPPPRSVMPVRPNPHFVGRTQDLKEIATDLKGGGATALGEIAVRASSGLGGIGKTQLASEFVYRYGAYFHSVYWLNFGDPAGIPGEVASCGGSSGMQFGPEFHRLPMEEQVNAVMAEFQSVLPRLLVFDNCDDEELLHQWLPAFGASRVLITSLREIWDPSLGVNSHPVNPLNRFESVQLLRKSRPDLTEDNSDLDAIAAELGDLPLALDLAGRYLSRYNREVTPAYYLEELRQPELLDHPSLRKARGISPTKHDMDVWRTFAVSYRRLNAADETDSIALKLLARFAHLAVGEPIPEYLAAGTLKLSGRRYTPPEPDTAFRDALERLTNLGLLRKIADVGISMHRLVAAFVCIEASDPAAQTPVEEACVYAANQAHLQGQPARQVQLLPRLRSVTSASWGRMDELAASVCTALYINLAQLRQYKEAMIYADRAWRISRDLYGRNDPSTLQSRFNVGRLYAGTGDSEQARTIYQEVLQAQEQLYGPDDLDVAATLNNLGASFAEDELYHETLPRFHRALQIREEVWRSERKAIIPERRQVSGSMVAESNENMGHLLMDLGRVRYARPYLDRALRIMGNVFQEEHQRDAFIRLTRARTQLAIGERERAVEDLQYVLHINRTVASSVSEQATMAVAIQGNIMAQATADAGLHEADRTYWLEWAYTWLDQALKAAEDRYGQEHPVTGALHRVLGTIREARGDSEAARENLERAEACRRHNLEGAGQGSAAMIHTSAINLMYWGLYDEAHVYLEHALDLKLNVADEWDFETSKSLLKLGVLSQLQRNGTKARHYFDRTLAARSHTCGADHPATRIVRENIELLGD